MEILSVSYTHLDVYKRQRSARDVRPGRYEDIHLELRKARVKAHSEPDRRHLHPVGNTGAEVSVNDDQKQVSEA